MHEAILQPSPEAQNSLWIKSRIEENIGQFSAGPINKAVSSFTNRDGVIHKELPRGGRGRALSNADKSVQGREDFSECGRLQRV